MNASLEHSTAYEASHVFQTTPSRLYSFSGYNSKGSSQFVQLHDAAALPSDTSIPVITFVVAASSNFSFDFGPNGVQFNTGVVGTNSSAGPTLTIGSADVWFQAVVGP